MTDTPKERSDREDHAPEDAGRHTPDQAEGETAAERGREDANPGKPSQAEGEDPEG